VGWSAAEQHAALQGGQQPRARGSAHLAADDAAGAQVVDKQRAAVPLRLHHLARVGGRARQQHKQRVERLLHRLLLALAAARPAEQLQCRLPFIPFSSFLPCTAGSKGGPSVMMW
jgi:hypothetical protein